MPGLIAFEHFRQPSGRETAPLCYPPAAPLGQMQQCPLAILPDAGDQVRLLRSEPPPSTPASSPAIPEDPTQPRYPEVQVQLSGEDGNAFAILGRTTAALRAAGVSSEEIDAFFAEATSGDYDHLVQTTMRWVHWE